MQALLFCIYDSTSAVQQTFESPHGLETNFSITLLALNSKREKRKT
jgi:hypothetical protein